ncbi:SusC/RagA family TonB-linked outer membrane protein [Pedobacter sp. PWIIR3]
MRFKFCLVLFFILFGLIGVSSAQKINYVNRQVKLLTVFSEIQKQTGFSVTWNEREVNAEVLVNANFVNADLKVALDQLVSGQPFEYQIVGNIIAVFLRKSPDNATAAAELKDTATVLREVAIVSTGYQKIPQPRATGSFVLVDTTQFNRRVGPDVLSRLEGIASGLLFNRNTETTNSGNLDLSIRGRSTIYANDQPLIVLDNFPYVGDFNAINPNDIESITILKDAAAAAIWGVRAGNGVIVMTTHRGKISQPLKVSFNANLSVAQRPDLFYNPSYIGPSAFIDKETFYFNKGSYDDVLANQTSFPVISPVIKALYRQRQGLQTAAETAAQLDALRGIDLRNDELKYYYRNQVSQQYALSLAGGTSFSSHYFSLGFDRSDPSIIRNNSERITLNSQNTIQVLKKLDLTFGAMYGRSLRQVDSTVRDLPDRYRLAPYSRLADENGNPLIQEVHFSNEYKAAALANGFLDWNFNPLAELGSSPSYHTSNDLRLNTGLSYRLFPGFTASVKYQFQDIDNKTTRHYTMDYYEVRNIINRFAIVTNGKVTGYNVPLGDQLYERNSTAHINSTRFQLDYQKQFGKHQVTAMAGHEYSSNSSEISGILLYGYDPVQKTSVPVEEDKTFALNPTGTATLTQDYRPRGLVDRIRSTYTNASYSYLNRYLVSASARVDGSNYFGVKTNQKYIPLWSAGAVWKLSQEKFYTLSWLPVLQLRASYGFNGNLDKRTTGITTVVARVPTVATNNLPTANLVNIGNPELRWEKIGITNLGLNFESKNQLISGTAEYYFKNGSDILGDQVFPGSSGVRVLRGNFAAIKARGLDLSVTVKNLRGRVGWETSFLFSMIKDKVTKYENSPLSALNYVGVENGMPILGQPLSGVYSYPFAGYDPVTGEQLGYLDGKPSKDYTAIVNNSTMADLIYHGTARPTKFGSMINSIAYDRFTLSFNVSFKLDYYIRNSQTDYFNVLAGNNSLTNAFYLASAVSAAKGDHVRLQDVNLDFDAGSLLGKPAGLKRLKFYIYANNLGVLWKANKFGLDPDLVPQTQSNMIYPTPASFTFGFKGNW